MQVPRQTESQENQEQHQQQQLVIPKLHFDYWTLQRQMRLDHLQTLLRVQKKLHESADFQVTISTPTGTHLLFVHAGPPA